jgi:hypothetical protein
MTALEGWENFYVIVGSSAGALIGLQFVVVTLIADMPIAGDQALAGDAFATPTIVHFCAVLLTAAVVCAPWQGAGSAAILWGALGLAGVVYSLIVARRMRLHTVYRPQLEDWKTGCFTLCCPWWPTGRWQRRRMRSAATHIGPCSVLERRRYCC